MIVVHFPSWFPDAEKPLNGNFILRQIETIGAETTSIILHHTIGDYKPDLPDKDFRHSRLQPEVHRIYSVKRRNDLYSVFFANLHVFFA